MTPPRISVLMAVYNGAIYLREAIDSVIAQTFGDFEFVIVDDGSTDESVRIVRSYADPRIKLHIMERNSGQTTALNFGLRLCKGAYVARMDGDDICHPERFARQVALLDADTSLGIVGSAAVFVDGQGRTLDISSQPVTDAEIRFVSLTRNPFHHPAVMLRRSVLTGSNLEYDERFQANQDFELWSRLLPLTRAANLPQILLRYRIHGSNISVKRLAEQQRSSSDFCRKRQYDEGLPEQISPATLFEIFDAIHGSRIVGSQRVPDASPAIEAFLTLAEARAQTSATREWAASLVLRALLLRHVKQGRLDFLFRALKLSIRAPLHLFRTNFGTLLFRCLRVLDREPLNDRSLMVIVASLRVGGTERHLGAVLPELARAGWKITVWRTSTDGPIGAILRESGIEIVDADVSTDFTAWLPPVIRGFVAQMIRALPVALYIFRERPAIIHAFLPAPTVIAGLACMLTRSNRFVASRRALNFYQKESVRAALAERFFLKRATAILGNSQAICQDLAAEGYDKSRCALIYNGLPPLVPRDTRAAFRARESWPDGEVAVTIVANLLGYKGHLDLIEAVARLPAGLPEWRLNIVGRDDGEGPAIITRARTLGVTDRIRFVGESDDIGSILLASDIVVSASHEEGFSNSIIEAMGYGLPVIATAVGGTVEAVADGVSGYLVPARAPERMAAALRDLIADGEKRTRMGAAGRARVQRLFSFDACVRNYNSLYAGLSLAPQARPSDLVPEVSVIEKTT